MLSSKTGEPNHVRNANVGVLRKPFYKEKKIKQSKRITLSMIDAIGAGERLIGVAFCLLLTGHRVQFVALTQQGHPIEVVAPEILLGYTTANRSNEFSKSIKVSTKGSGSGLRISSHAN